MGRHHQMRQRKLRRNGWCRSFNPARQSRQFVRDPVRPQGVQNAKLTAVRGSSTAIGEIDDLSLPDSIDSGVGLFDKTFQAFGEPVIPASLLAVAIHSLLDYDPLAIIGHDESVQIEIKAILHGGAVDLGDEPARIRERRPVKSHPLPDCDKLLRRLPGMLATAPTDMDPKLIRERRQAPLQRADHARCDARGMPIHAHHRAKGLEPERVGKAAQQLVAAILMDNRFAHHRAEAGHAICQPPWHLPAMQRKIGASSSLCHLFSCESLAYFEMTLSSNGCRWALLCASARAK